MSHAFLYSELFLTLKNAIPEGGILHSHRRGNLKSYIFLTNPEKLDLNIILMNVVNMYLVYLI
jgi:hypothetical protein